MMLFAFYFGQKNEYNYSLSSYGEIDGLAGFFTFGIATVLNSNMYN